MLTSVLRNLHWIIILLAIGKLGFSYYEKTEEQSARDQLIADSQNDIGKLETTKREIKKYLSNIESEKGKIERVALEIEKTQQLLPSDLSDAENINLLRKMAEDVNIKEISISPENEDDRGFYIARKYRFKARATYLQFLIMFEKISESKRILNIGEVNFIKLEQPQRSKFQLINGDFILEAYKYNTKYKEDRGIDKIDQQFKENSDQEKVPSKGKGSKAKKAASSEP